MFDPVESKPVTRAELETEASADDYDSVDHALEARFRNEFEQRYVDGAPQTEIRGVDRADDTRSCLGEETLDQGEDGYSFRLFARPVLRGLLEGKNQGAQKIALRSPSPANGESSFVNPERAAAYYFTGDTSVERAEQYRKAAVSGEQLLEGLKLRWPGSELPWRVTVLKSTGWITANSSLLMSQTVTGKRIRIGKKRRIAMRKHVAAEKEKRTRKNREKKVKKRQKDKLNKFEVAEVVEAQRKAP